MADVRHLENWSARLETNFGLGFAIMSRNADVGIGLYLLASDSAQFWPRAGLDAKVHRPRPRPRTFRFV